MQSILVTGANGFVGRHVVAELLANGLSVIAVGGPQSAAEHERLQYLPLDLTNQAAAERIDFKSVSGVIHLAGMAAVGPSFDDPMRYITTNIGIEVNLFEAAMIQKATPRFLIISSGSLYDSAAALPLTESSAVSPNSPYAASKLGQEQLAGYYGHRGFEYIIARPFNHVGPGQGLGFIVSDIAQQLIAVERGESPVIRVGNLDARRDYTDVRDIARAYRLLLNQGTAGALYNVCSGVAHKGSDILDTLLKQSDSTPTIERDPARLRPADTAVIYGNHAKITRDTGWEPAIPFSKTLDDTLQYWREQV